jgi:Family of unknown function (DUF6084)
VATPAATRASPATPAVGLDFSVRGAAPVEHAAAPAIGFELAVTSRGEVPIRSVVLDVQVQIAARRRSYGEREQARLHDLFGTPERWADTLRSVPWLRTTQVVPAFAGETVVSLQVPCTYDFEVAGSKYLAALADGEVPLELLFGGTIFYTAPGGALQTAMIGWDSEAEYRLPVSVWRATMDRYFPHSAWLRVDRDTFDRLYAYRARRALPSWEHALGRLLDAEEDG